MDGLEIVTGAGGALGVAGWVIWHQAQLIERMRKDLRELGDAHRDDQRAVYARLVEVVGDLQRSLTALEGAVMQLGSRASRGGENGQASGRD